MNSSSEINWHVDRIETFVILGAEFDVQEAKKIIVASPRPIQKILVEDLKFISRWVPTFWRIEKDADLSIPIIMVTMGGGFLPIDGWHRMARCFKRKEASTLPVVALTPEETRKIQKSYEK